MDKRSYLEEVARHAAERGTPIQMHHIGDRMYAEAPDVKPGRILDLPLSRLHALRRSVMKDILRESEGQSHVIINTHATFRWRHGLFSAFDFDQLLEFKPDMVITLVDNIEVVGHRMRQDHAHLDATLKDLMVWREEEIMASELLAQALGIANHFYVLSRGRHQDTVDTCLKLITRRGLRKVYPSFPMSHVVGMPDVLKEIDEFRERLGRDFIAFDPADVDEKLLQISALKATQEGNDWIETQSSSFSGGEKAVCVPVKQVLDIAGDIDGQIYARDFKMVRQSDMIVSLVPELPDGTPALSSGVERELQHAFDHGRDVFVVWLPKKEPSPFITETATCVFRSVDEAFAWFEQKGWIQAEGLFA